MSTQFKKEGTDSYGANMDYRLDKAGVGGLEQSVDLLNGSPKFKPEKEQYSRPFHMTIEGCIKLKESNITARKTLHTLGLDLSVLMTLWKNVKSSKKRKSVRTSGSEASSVSNSDPQISRTCIALKFVPVMFVMSGVTPTKTGIIFEVDTGRK